MVERHTGHDVGGRVDEVGDEEDEIGRAHALLR
jgi:hypothetical protein